MKKVILLAGLLLIGVTAFGQTKEQGFSVSAQVGYTLGDEVFSDFFGIAYGANLDYTISEGESVSFGISAGYMQFSGKDGFDGEGFWNAKANIIFPDLFAEGQNVQVGLGYATAADSDADYDAISAETFYQFRAGEKITISPGVIYFAGNDDAGDVFVGAIRTTFKF